MASTTSNAAAASTTPPTRRHRRDPRPTIMHERPTDHTSIDFHRCALTASTPPCLPPQPSLGLTPGERVLLVYPPSLDFMVAFYACVRARLIAVPVFPPGQWLGRARVCVYAHLNTIHRGPLPTSNELTKKALTRHHPRPSSVCRPAQGQKGPVPFHRHPRELGRAGGAHEHDLRLRQEARRYQIVPRLLLQHGLAVVA